NRGLLDVIWAACVSGGRTHLDCNNNICVSVALDPQELLSSSRWNHFVYFHSPETVVPRGVNSDFLCSTRTATITVTDEKEKKRLEAQERRRENQRLLDEENSRLKGKQPKEPSGKVTRAQIEETLQKDQELKQPAKEKEVTHLDVPLEENINRIIPEEGSAHNIEDAIAVLSTKEDLDRHPERRMKAAYTAFEEANMARLKMENPNMRMSQLKQQLKKEWGKSPENPLNQRFVSYNTK
uniref:Coiled-coil domain containing 124 n=1 Tax=Pygocentrus nattereri TaxID=42514 RepID=A0AAR2KCD7_PYGNA